MSKKIQGVVLAASMLLAGGAQALTVGDIDVKSGLGQRFNASIPVTLAAGEDIAQGCVRIEESPNSKFKDVPMIKRYDMTIQRSGKVATIYISTNEPISEPLVRLPLLIRCGAKVSTQREYMITQTLSGTEKR